MVASTDLWGNIATEELVRTPVSILREQATLLGKKTGNVLEARVETFRLNEGWLGHRLLLVAPSLDDYTYELLKFSHPIQIYPVNPDTFEGSADNIFLDSLKIGSSKTTAGRSATTIELRNPITDEESFVKWLGAKLSSAETHRIITNLLSQSRS